MVVNNDYINVYNREMKNVKGFKKITFVELVKNSYYSTTK